MIYKIEEHYYVTKNNTVKCEYRIFRKPYVYSAKTKSQLTTKEKEFPKTKYYHF